MLVLPVHGPRLILSLSKAIKTVDLSGPTKAIRATKCTVLRTNCADTSQNLQPKSKPVPTIRCQILFLLPYIRSHPARSPLSYPSSDPSLWSPPRPADLEKYEFLRGLASRGLYLAPKNVLNNYIKSYKQHKKANKKSGNCLFLLILHFVRLSL